MSAGLAFETERATSADGTTITYEVCGAGPGLLLVPGGVRAAHHYRRMAACLADAHTVYVVNRRGRCGSGPHGSDYGIETECADLAAGQQKAQASVVFGHSVGGVVALELAVRSDVDRIVLYEPALTVPGSPPADWLSGFEHALGRGDHARAMAILIKGTEAGGPVLRHVPTGLLSLPLRAFLRGDEGREMAELLPTFPFDVRLTERLGYPAERYRTITAETLILMGDRSPAYLRDACHLLEETLPQAHLVTMPKLGHNAPDGQAPERVADLLRQFITSADVGIA